MFIFSCFFLPHFGSYRPRNSPHSTWNVAYTRDWVDLWAAKRESFNHIHVSQTFLQCVKKCEIWP